MRTSTIITGHPFSVYVTALFSLVIYTGITVLPAPVQAQDNLFAGGSGTEEDPWQIETAEHLQNINEELDAHYILVNDIDASGTETWNNGAGFEPIGEFNDMDHPLENWFIGTLDGDGHEIHGLTINRPDEEGVGLFAGVYEQAIIGNIHFSEADITGAEFTGVLAGINFGFILDASADGTVEGTLYTGILVGGNYNVIDESYAEGQVFGESVTGGLSGFNMGEILNSGAAAEVTGAEFYTGGFTGLNHQNGLIRDTYATGTVEAGDNISGGLVGSNRGAIENSHAEGDVTGADRVGALVGDNDGAEIILNSYATGDATGEIAVGALIGANLEGSRIAVSYAEGDAEGVGSVGGLAGYSNAEIENSYALGNVQGGAEFGSGGLIGTFTPIAQQRQQDRTMGSIAVDARGEGAQIEVDEPVHDNLTEDQVAVEKETTAIRTPFVGYSFAAGEVQGENYSGGLIGINYEDAEITAGYWDTETTLQDDGVGEGASDGVIGLTSDEMTGDDAENHMNELTFDTAGGWETVADSYPELIWQEIPGDDAEFIVLEGPDLTTMGEISESGFSVIAVDENGNQINLNRTTIFDLESEGDASFHVAPEETVNGYETEIERVVIHRNQSSGQFWYQNNEAGEDQTITSEFIYGTEGLEGELAQHQVDVTAEVHEFLLVGPPAKETGELSKEPFELIILNEAGAEMTPAEPTAFALDSDGDPTFYDDAEGGSVNEIQQIQVSDEETRTQFWYRDHDQGVRTVTAEFAQGDDNLEGQTDQHKIEVLGSLEEEFAITPQTGSDQGSVTVNIFGVGFEGETDVVLAHEDHPDIKGSVTSVERGGTRMRVRFDLSGQPQDSRDVEITDPGGQTFVFEDAFTIVPGEANLWTRIHGLNDLEEGETATININYGNSGEIDLHDIMLFVRMPAGLEFEIRESDMVIPGMETSVGSDDFDGHDEYEDFDPWFEIDDEVVLPLWIYKLNSGESESIQLEITVSDVGLQQNLSEIYGSAIEAEIGALPPQASEFTRTGDFDSADPGMLFLFSDLIMSAALDEDDLTREKLGQIEALLDNPPETASGHCMPGPREPDDWEDPDQIQEARESLAEDMQREASELADGNEWAVGLGVGLAATVACASTPFGWAACAGAGAAAGAASLYSMYQVADRYDDLQDEDCNDPNNDDEYDPQACADGGDCGSDGYSYGDPHMQTFDGLSYGFHAVGEFVLARSTIDDLEIQTRFEKMEPDLTRFTIVTATAMNVQGDQVVIEETKEDKPPYLPTLKVNGTDTELPDPGEVIELSEGGEITHFNETIAVEWPDMEARVYVWQGSGGRVTGHRALGVETLLSNQYAGHLEGLLGSKDGDINTDFVTREGEKLARPLSYNELYREFGDSWRITQEESLFGTETFKDLSMPESLFTTDDLDESERQQAREVCEDRGITEEARLNNCIFDIALTGETAFADDASRLISSGAEEQVREWVDENESKIQINLKAAMADGENFSFSGTGPIGNFTLEGADELTQVSDSEVIHPIDAGSYDITFEASLDEWSLVDITCNNGNASAQPENTTVTVDLSEGETTRCTFKVIPEGTLQAFLLEMPEDEAVVEVEGTANDEVELSWQPAAASDGAGVTYTWMFDDSEELSDPILEKQADADGTEPAVSLTLEELDEFLDEQEVEEGEELTGYWTAVATYDDAFSLESDDQRELTFQRGQVTSSVAAEEIPDKFSLGKNYPNPFNPNTQISYELPENTDVKLTVFNILGREVATLVNEHQTTGKYEITFDASDLASGKYIYRFEAGNFTESKSMMFVK